jgi:phosphate acyltransferase
MRIAVDVMGGDHGCGVVIEGVRLALEANKSITELYLVGDEPQIKSALTRCHCRDERLRYLHADQVLTMEDKPVVGLRKKKNCSILRAIDLVKDGRAEAVISPGNTGGIIAAATIRLRPLEGVDRAAIATVIPTAKREFVLIDSGATPDCKPLNLVQFGIMGSVYSREILGHKRPRVGVLSNGKEEIKGTDLTREAARLFQKIDLHFVGYVEGHDLFNDAVDVVVTDGFVGNIVLKTCESMGRGIVRLLKSELTANPVRKIGAKLAQGALMHIKRRMDPDTYGGAPVLGLNGNVIKAHGSAREFAIMNAVRVAAESVRHQIAKTIQSEVARANEILASETSSQPLLVTTAE